MNYKKLFYEKIALEYKTRSKATFILSNRAMKSFKKWLIKKNKKYKNFTAQEIQKVIGTISNLSQNK